MRSREAIQNQEERILWLEQRLARLEAEVKLLKLKLKDGEKSAKAPGKSVGRPAAKK